MTDDQPTKVEAKAQRKRKAMLRDLKGWALSREGMNDPASRAKLEAIAEKADSSLKAMETPKAKGTGDS